MLKLKHNICFKRVLIWHRVCYISQSGIKSLDCTKMVYFYNDEKRTPINTLLPVFHPLLIHVGKPLYAAHSSTMGYHRVCKDRGTVSLTFP